MKDQIRQIANPDQEFNFFISKNERVRETQREAMDSELSLTLPAFSLTIANDLQLVSVASSPPVSKPPALRSLASP